MDTLRRRIPFKVGEDDDANTDGEVLDDQQQEELIEVLRKENEIVNQRYSTALKVVVGLSCMLQLITFNQNPLLTVFPIQGTESSIPLPAIFTLLAVYIHANLIIMFFANEFRVRFQFQFSNLVGPLSYQFLYLLSAVAPTLCLFLQKPWQAILWWCTTPLMVFIVHAVMDAIQQSNQGIADLETMKYKAPGA
ncbi:hypothetical protein GALMADRAFT_134357 [Galerina marginata CBS 339.88]|uniref:Uncharacterized protein n=1 Tax=Galerina marginata (strain CBS 339.88) TaxID=685588 RepID=A0A067TSC1_GALM3|nr:hypothetical protein GALMADRAFT_134357 [Galerina marginata CBS 339.88]